MTMTGTNGNQAKTVSNSSNILVLLDSTFSYSKINIGKNNTKILAFDLPTHHELSNLGISHSLSDDYLKRDEREDLYDFVISLYNWYDQIPETKNLELDGINLLSIMNPFEFHEYFLTNLITFFSIKKIIEEEKPDEIFVTGRLSKFLHPFFDKQHVTILNDTNVTYEKGGQDKGFTADQIELRFNILSKPISIYISKKTYSKIKNIYENTLCNLFNLWFDVTNKKKGILLLEFNPDAYKELLINLNKTNKPIILLNRRRSAIWNKESLKILKMCNNCKILNYKKFLNSKDKKYLSQLKKKYQENLQNLWNNDEIFANIFSKSGISFWHIVKRKMVSLYDNRLYDYLEYLVTTKKILESTSIGSIAMLNEIGETESTVLKINKSKNPTFLFQHGFIRYDPSISEIQWRYENQKMIPLRSDNFLIWGESDYEFFTKFGIQTNKLKITGSPRHDSYFNYTKNHNNSKTILLTLVPITDISGLGDTNLAVKYEELLTNIINIINNISGVTIIVKLHPGESWHNSSLLEFFQKNHKNILVYQIRSPMELIQSSDLVINVSGAIRASETSTIMLESMILHKPTLEISLDEQFKNLEYDDITPIVSLSYRANIEKYIKKMLDDDEFKQILLQKNKLHLKKFLANHGKASQETTNMLTSF